MSLLRAVRSLVSRKEDKKEIPALGESLGNDSPTTNRNKTVVNKDFQNQVDKLKSFWTLYTNMSEESDRAQQLSKILPLFISIYEGQEFKLITETFGERNLKQFTFIVAKKLVRDIRTTWKANLPPEANAKEVVKMLSTPVEDNGGFELLCALEIICVTTSNVDVATDAAVPSTLVKVIQLFFSLPPGSGKTKDRQTCTNRVICLLRSISRYRSVVMELLNTEELEVLFNVLPIPCPPHNAEYKEGVLAIVSSIVKLHIDRETIDYFESKGSIKTLVSNLRTNMDAFTPEYVIQIWATTIEWLKSSCNVAGSLMNGFKAADGYSLISDTLLWMETKDIPPALMGRYLDVIGAFVYVGRDQLTVPASISPYNNPVIESVKDQEKIVRNLTAFQILQNYFLISHRADYRARVLDTILSNYAEIGRAHV